MTIAAAPMGLLTGYGISALIITISKEWQWAFLVIILMMVPLVCILFCVQRRYLDIKEHLRLKAIREQLGSNPNDAHSEADISAASPAAELNTDYEKY